MKLNRIGDINLNNYGSKMVVAEYNNALDITVEFTNGFRIKTCYSNFKKGMIKSPYDI